VDLQTILQADRQYETYTIRTAEPAEHDGEHYIEISTREGGCLLAANPDQHPAPAPGTACLFFGKGFGFPVRGVATADHVYYYKTARDFNAAERARALADDLKRRDDFNQKSGEFSAGVAMLPPIFQERIKGFIAHNADWAYQFGFYELHTCRMAAALIEHCRFEQAVEDLYEATVEEQVAAIPELSEASGNSAGMSFTLARLYFQDESLVLKMHGAMCRLVGCQSYGCHAARQNAA
jgi:hypothetical protein